MDLDGLAVTLLDTAGLREAGEPVEALGIERARERAETRRPAGLPGRRARRRSRVWAWRRRPGDLVVLAKADLRRRTRGRRSPA